AGHLAGGDVQTRQRAQAFDLFSECPVLPACVLATGEARHALRTRRSHRIGHIQAATGGDDARRVRYPPQHRRHHVTSIRSSIKHPLLDMDVRIDLVHLRPLRPMLYRSKILQCPSETTSTDPSTTLIAVSSSIAYPGTGIRAAHFSASAMVF